MQATHQDSMVEGCLSKSTTFVYELEALFGSDRQKVNARASEPRDLPNTA